MSTIRDIADLLNQISKIVKDTRSILKAINDGKEFLLRKFPNASKDFSKLLLQMEKTMEGLATATGVAKNFKFTLGSDYARERDLTRFNKYMINHDKQVVKLRNNIKSLKAKCDEIKTIRDKLNEQIKGRSWSRMFSLVGVKASRKRNDLASAISDFYSDDQRMISIIEETLTLTESALDDVNKALGPPGHAYPDNVPIAAKTLGVYAEMFKEPHRSLQDLAKQLGDAARKFK